MRGNFNIYKQFRGVGAIQRGRESLIALIRGLPRSRSVASRSNDLAVRFCHEVAICLPFLTWGIQRGRECLLHLFAIYLPLLTCRIILVFCQADS